MKLKLKYAMIQFSMTLISPWLILFCSKNLELAFSFKINYENLVCFYMFIMVISWPICFCLFIDDNRSK